MKPFALILMAMLAGCEIPTPAPSSTPSPSASPSPVVSVTPSPSPTQTAAACVPGPNGSLKGYDVFPAGNPWRQDISAAPVDAKSSDYITSIGAKPLRTEFGSGLYQGDPIGVPYLVIDNTTPLLPLLKVRYASSTEPGLWPFPLDMPRERPLGVSDHHIIAINCGANMLYEAHQALPHATGWNVDSAARFDLTSLDGASGRPKGWTSADAAGLPIFAGLVRPDEVFEQKEIRHALRFTVENTQSGYVSPATHSASNKFNPALLPMGARLRLKASVEIAKFSEPNQVILKALKRYGMYMADNGGDMFITGVPDPRWDNDDLRKLMALTAFDFEVIETGPITKVGAWP